LLHALILHALCCCFEQLLNAIIVYAWLSLYIYGLGWGWAV